MNTMTLVQGDTRVFDLQANTKDGDPADLTDVDLIWMAKAHLSDADVAALITKTSAPGGGIIVDPDQTGNTGQATVTIQSEDTALLVTNGKGRVLHWGLRGIVDSEPITLDSGAFVIVAGTVQATSL